MVSSGIPTPPSSLAQEEAIDEAIEILTFAKSSKFRISGKRRLINAAIDCLKYKVTATDE